MVNYKVDRTKHLIRPRGREGILKASKEQIMKKNKFNYIISCLRKDMNKCNRFRMGENISKI